MISELTPSARQHRQDMFRGVSQAAHLRAMAVAADDEQTLHDHGQLDHIDRGPFKSAGEIGVVPEEN